VSLFARVGHRLAAAVEPYLTRCLLHGHQPSVLVCPCALLGAVLAESSMDGVFCLEHGGDEAENDVELQALCFRCALDRGLLPHLAPSVDAGVAPD